MTITEKINHELKAWQLSLSDIQGEVRKQKNSIYSIRVALVKYLYKQGYSLREIANVLQIHHSTVARLNEIYTPVVEEKDVVFKRYVDPSNIKRMKRYLKIEHYGA